jgi:hypothetical protein
MLGDLGVALGIYLCKPDNQVDIFGYHLPGLLGVGAAFASVYGAFAKFDADQSDENRKFVREWLLSPKADDRQWARFFKELFTKVFGERHLSAKCIGRSVSLSVALLTAIWMYWYVKYGRMSLEKGAPISILVVRPVVWTMLAVVADYLSLWKTRMLLTRSNLFDNGLTAMAIVVGDALATIIILLALISVPYLAALWLADLPYQLRQMFIDEITDYIHLAFSWPHLEDSLKGFKRMLFLAPLFTSAWLWVYLIVAYGMRGLSRLPSWLRPLSKVMDFENHPVRTIGYVAATVSAAIVGMITLV